MGGSMGDMRKRRCPPCQQLNPPPGTRRVQWPIRLDLIAARSDRTSTRNVGPSAFLLSRIWASVLATSTQVVVFWLLLDFFHWVVDIRDSPFCQSPFG